jgi:GATA zinc finger
VPCAPGAPHCRVLQVCKNCGTDCTPFWRKDKNDQLPLCNACGLYAAKNGSMRPASLWKQEDGLSSAPKALPPAPAAACNSALAPPGGSPPSSMQLSDGGVSAGPSGPPTTADASATGTSRADPSSAATGAHAATSPGGSAALPGAPPIATAQRAAAMRVPSAQVATGGAGGALRDAAGACGVSASALSAPTPAPARAPHHGALRVPTPQVALPPAGFGRDDTVQLPSAAELLTVGLSPHSGLGALVPGALPPPAPPFMPGSAVMPYGGARFVQLGTIGPQQFPIVGFAGASSGPKFRLQRTRSNAESTLPPLPPLATSAPPPPRGSLLPPPGGMPAKCANAVRGVKGTPAALQVPDDTSPMATSLQTTPRSAAAAADEPMDDHFAHDVVEPAFDPAELEALFCDDGQLELREGGCESFGPDSHLLDLDSMAGALGGGAARAHSAPVDPFGLP